MYGTKGYVDFESHPSIEIDQIRHSVSLTIELDEQTQFRVRKVEVVGLDPGLEKVLRAKLSVGDIFNSGLMEEFYQQNKTVIPSDWRPRSKIKRDPQSATLDLAFDFRSQTCPPAKD